MLLEDLFVLITEKAPTERSLFIQTGNLLTSWQIGGALLPIAE